MTNKYPIISLGMVLTILSACDTDSAFVSPKADRAIEMCKVAIPQVQPVRQSVRLVNAFHTPRMEPDVVRLRYEIIDGLNAGANGTVRCFYVWEGDVPSFSKITRDADEIDVNRLPNLSLIAQRATREKD